MIGVSSRTRSTTWTRHPLKRLLAKRRQLGFAFALGSAGLVIGLAATPAVATGGPSGWLLLNGNIRNLVTASPPVYDWGNHGTAYDTTACSNSGINAADTAGILGSGGIFNCGKPGTASGTNTNPVPIAPSLTAAAATDPSIAASAFIVDPLFNSNNKNTGLTCPVTGATPTGGGGDPTALTTGSSKNDLPLAGFVYAPTSLQPKDDLGNVYAVAHRATGINEVFFGAERVVNNGASHVDFEFLQSAVSLVPSGTTGAAACTGNLSGNRTGGDFLAAVDFSIGGTLGGFTIYEWSCGGTATTISEGTPCDPGTVLFPNAQYVIAPAAATAAFNLTVNGAGSIPCGGWVCRGQMKTDNAQTVSTNEFMEGGVNLDTLGFTGCVSTFLPHTRSSPDINSTLQDFAGPVSFNTCSIATSPGAPVTDIRSGAITDSATVSGFVGTPGTVTFKLYGPFATGAGITGTSCTAGKLLFTSAPVGTADTGSPAHYPNPAVTPNPTRFTPTSVGVYQWVATYSGGIAGVCGDPTEQVRVVDANISISPNGVNEVGHTHTFTITVNAFPADLAAAFSAVTTTVLPAPSSQNSNCASPVVVPNTTATCNLTINNSTAGVFTANASDVITIGGLPITRATDGVGGDSGPATKDYVDANITIAPSGVNEVGTAHTFTVTLTALPGGDTTAGSFSIAPSVSPSTSLLNNTCGNNLTAVSNVATCSFQINSSIPATFTANATGMVTFTDPDGSTGHTSLTLTRSTDSTHGSSGPATKIFVDASITIGPSAANPVNTPHTFTITVTAFPQGTTVSFGPITTSVSPVPTSMSSTCGNPTINGNVATCTLTINSSTSNVFTANATAQVTMGGVTVTRSTSGNSGPGGSGPATKVYVSISTTQSAASVLQGTAISDTATVMGLNPADGTPPAGTTGTPGTVSFTLFGPFTSASAVTCVVGTSPVAASFPNVAASTSTSTTATYQSPSTTPGMSGVYAWVATYNGNSRNVSVTSGCMAELVTVTTSGLIAPTNTTCSNFLTANHEDPTFDLDQVHYTVSGGMIAQSVNPGVFFYYTKFTVPASGSLVVHLNQSNVPNLPGLLFGVAQAPATSQVSLFNGDCSNFAGTATIAISGTNSSQVTVTYSGLTAGQTLIIGVKYSTKTIAGQPAPSPSTVHYTFTTTFDASPTIIDTDPAGLDLVTP